MKWDTLQQLIRIVGYSAGAALLGDGVADSQQFQAALGGLISIASFGWWFVKEKGN